MPVLALTPRPRIVLSLSPAGREPSMLFRLVNAEYDFGTERAYVELRANDDDGGEIIAVTIFSFRSKSKLSKPEIRQEIVRKARYALKRAAVAT
jgi:hypothetical protein